MVKKFIKTIWELPQNIVGLIVKKIFKATPYTTYQDAIIYSWKRNDGVSLGKHIFVPFSEEDPSTYRVQQFIKHEYGHTVQSGYFGWLYLLVIGLPSLIWAGCFGGYRFRTKTSYYSFYTEKWANKLGGVDEDYYV